MPACQNSKARMIARGGSQIEQHLQACPSQLFSGRSLECNSLLDSRYEGVRHAASTTAVSGSFYLA